MTFVKCEICSGQEIIWDMTKTSTGYVHARCPTGSSADITPLRHRKTTHDESAADAVETATAIEARRKSAPFEVVGFDQPEEGSKDRYDKRRAEQPWAKHRFWWLVHNTVSHPLIGLVPWRPMFRFHDWTSKKMHGR